ncbi:MAG TPA: hypothetical protein VGA55_08810, partial [Bacteroidota bacterium]
MPSQKPPTTSIHSQVSEILKKVDGFLKKEDLEAAQTHIDLARQADPKNMYVHAYDERIHLLIEEHKRNKEA